jgi:cytidine deaminase
MRTEPLTDEDRELIDAAMATLADCHVAGRHRCAAAMRSTTGEVYTSINLMAGGVTDIHAEPIALASAVQAGDPDIETSVAVIYEDDDSSNPARVVAACGVCRELLHAFVPDVSIIVPGEDGPVRAPLAELLPASPY